MNSGRSFGRQLTSTSLRRCETMPPALTPGAAASPLKCSGIVMRIFSFSSTRCRSTCSTAFFAGCRCTSFSTAAWLTSPTFRLRIVE